MKIGRTRELSERPLMNPLMLLRQLIDASARIEETDQSNLANISYIPKRKGTTMGLQDL